MQSWVKKTKGKKTKIIGEKKNMKRGKNQSQCDDIDASGEVPKLTISSDHFKSETTWDLLGLWVSWSFETGGMG